MDTEKTETPFYRVVSDVLDGRQPVVISHDEVPQSDVEDRYSPLAYVMEGPHESVKEPLLQVGKRTILGRDYSGQWYGMIATPSYDEVDAEYLSGDGPIINKPRDEMEEEFDQLVRRRRNRYGLHVLPGEVDIRLKDYELSPGEDWREWFWDNDITAEDIESI